MLQRVQADFAHAARVSMLGELAASIAHELNQALTTIAMKGEVGVRLLNHSEPDLAEGARVDRMRCQRRAASHRGHSAYSNDGDRRPPEQTLLSLDEVIREALLFLRHEVEHMGCWLRITPTSAGVGQPDGQRHPGDGADGKCATDACYSDHALRSLHRVLHFRRQRAWHQARASRPPI
jgi:C4-dicarboxylate-specific signal transduction histidine kinase